MSCMIQTVRLVTKLFTLGQYTQGVVSINNESGEAQNMFGCFAMCGVSIPSSQFHDHQCCHHKHRCCGQMLNMGPDLGTEREL